VPLIDPELTVLAAQRQRFFDAGIMAVVSPPDTVKISGDKYLTYKFGKEKHIRVPETEIDLLKTKALFKSGRLGWPVVVKPRDGSASTNITYCRNEKQLENAFSNCPNSMIQEYVEGDEFGYDLFSDADYRPISVFCKRKLAMRAGETDKAVSTDDKNLIELGLKIAQAFQIFGPADVDVKTGKDGPMLLEINPRFGGGYPCSHLCGADFPAKLLAICKGQTLTPSIGDYPAGVYMFKQDEIISPTPDGIEAVTDLRRPKAR
jgi:carbamoyl-phosphate synthase large subunit